MGKKRPDRKFKLAVPEKIEELMGKRTKQIRNDEPRKNTNFFKKNNQKK